jgi:hypothetical protein
MVSRQARERTIAEIEYDKSEGVRTLINAINLLLASAPDDYTFWSAIYKFCIARDHRVMTKAEYFRLKEIEDQHRKRQAQDAVDAQKAFSKAREYLRKPRTEWISK